VSYAYANVAGYRSLCREAGVTPADLRSIADVKALPFMTKRLLRDNLEEFTSRAVPRRRLRFESTSGSSGIPFGFYHTSLNTSKENAFVHAIWERAGWKMGDRCVVLRGAFVGSRDSFWQFNEKKNELLLSSHFIGEDTYDEYVDVIARFRPRHLAAYPSAGAQLADLVISKGDCGKIPLVSVFLSSEQIYPWQREKLMAAFPGAHIQGLYGQTEQVILAATCEESDQYHVHPLYGFTEILDENDRDVVEGASGELVGTSFWSYATPMIRYRTMDWAQRGALQCDHCGRSALLLPALWGREQEVVFSKTGRRVTLTTIASIHSRLFDNIRQFRFFQETHGKLEFRVSPKPTFSACDTEALRAEILSRLGEGFDLNFAFVEQIPRGPGGKYSFLEQGVELARSRTCSRD
jgi:phenylacetate-CoA ligase